MLLVAHDFTNASKKENRLLETFSGDNTDLSLNFIPRMDKDTLMKGYIEVLNSIYSPHNITIVLNCL